MGEGATLADLNRSLGARGLDPRRTWAVLAAHLLERHGVELPIRVVVKTSSTTVQFVVPSTEDATLDDACRHLSDVEQPTLPDVVVVLAGDDVADGPRWLLYLSSGPGTFTAAPAGLALTAPVLSSSLATLAAQALEHAQRPLSSFPIVNDAERRALLEWGTAPVRLQGAPTFLHRVQSDPVCLKATVFDRLGNYTLEQIVERAHALRTTLQGEGVRPGDVVGLHVARDASYLVGVLGCWLAGAAFCPLDGRFPAVRLEYIVANAGARVILTNREALEFAHNIPRIAIPTQGGAAGKTSLPGAAEWPRPGDVAYVIYTSGSTGEPKGVEVTHANLANHLQSMSHTPGFRSGETLCALTSFSFDISILEMFLPLWAGGSLVIASDEAVGDPVAVAKLVLEHHVDVMQGTPTTWRLLLTNATFGPLRHFVGGEGLPRDVASLLLAGGGETWNLYGPTETTIWSSCDKIEEVPRFASAPLGRPIDGTVYRILDQRGRLVPRGCAGELFIGGRGVAKGYRGKPELTAQRFVADASGESTDRLYRTGDSVRLHDDGTLEFLGRIDNQVKVRGYRIELEDVEAALRQVPGITDAAAAALSAGSSVTLVGYVVGASIPEIAVLREHLRKRLPDYMIPTVIERLDALPLMPSGKVDRRALPRLTTRVDESMTATEAVLSSALARAFGVPSLGVDDDFIDLGGFSLARFVAVRLLREQGHYVDILDLYEHGSVRRLAQHIDSGRLASAPVESDVGHDVGLVTEYQKELFFDCGDEPSSRWNIVNAYALRPDVDLGRLEAALRRTFARHADARVSFHRTDAGVRRRVHDVGDVEWEIRRADLEPFRWEEDGPKGGIIDLMLELLGAPFDLAVKPPHKFVVVEGEHRHLVWLHHAIAMDGISVDILLYELDLEYEGNDEPIPPPRSFDQHVLRERQATSRLGAALGQHLGVSSPEESSSTSPLVPKCDPPALARQFARESLAECSATATAERLGFSIGLFMQAVFALALAKSQQASLMSDDRRVAYGLFVLNRDVDEELDVGLRLGMLPIEVEVRDDAPLSDWLHYFKAKVRGGLRFEAVGTGAWLAHMSSTARSRAWRITFNDGHCDHTFDRLPRVRRSIFPDEEVPPPLSTPGVHLEMIAAPGGDESVIAFYDESAISAEVMNRLMADMAKITARIRDSHSGTRVKDVVE